MRVEASKGEVMYRVFLNDEDVSDLCFAADDDEGWADCYIREENEMLRVTSPDGSRPMGELATERRTGNVRIARMRGDDG